ncbi:hypothetical protein ACTJKH_07235 [Microbacterium sp. 22215]|uniref:hypothetical protein n=1 Tax=Microbacterium sp. 22215 TaxID=3453893 RepID=UPI003F83F50B
MDQETANLLGVVISVAAVLGTWVPLLRRGPKRRLQFYTPLPGTFSDAHAAAAVVRGHPQKTTVVRVANTGRVSLPTDDWDGPLEVRFPGRVVESAEQTGARPADLRVFLSVDGDRATIAPLLLNSTDLVELTITTDAPSPVRVHARIRDVVKVGRKKWVYPPGTGKDGALLRGDKIMTFVVFPALFFALGLFLFLNTDESAVRTIAIWALPGIAVGFIGFIGIAVRRSRAWRPSPQ